MRYVSSDTIHAHLQFKLWRPIALMLIKIARFLCCWLGYMCHTINYCNCVSLMWCRTTVTFYLFMFWMSYEELIFLIYIINCNPLLYRWLWLIYYFVLFFVFQSWIICYFKDSMHPSKYYITSLIAGQFDKTNSWS